MAWEYKIELLEKPKLSGDWLEGRNQRMAEWLNERGQDGWELATIDQIWWTAIFKRQCFPKTPSEDTAAVWPHRH